MDEDEPWSYETENVDVDKVSLFATLVHEIGHTLGLHHSDVTDSIMYTFYTGKNQFGDDDILGIQNLYGKPQNVSVPPSTPQTPTSAMTPSLPSKTLEMDYPIDTSHIDLCNLKTLVRF